jgi:DNA mismatch endonuclease, patch repair protein
VFVDGCFWHGCPAHGSQPKSNALWWSQKITTNQARDLDTTEHLVEIGWSVVRIWEHEPTDHAAARVRSALRSAGHPTAG